MKRLYISIGLIALMAALSGLHIWRLTAFTGQISGLLTRAQALAAEEDWEQAARLTHQARERWSEEEGYLHLTLRHTDTDAIQLSMDEALAFLEGGEKQPAEYAAVNARLIGQLELLAGAELPTLTNLL